MGIDNLMNAAGEKKVVNNGNERFEIF